MPVYYYVGSTRGRKARGAVVEHRSHAEDLNTAYMRIRWERGS